jgi:hypothetical protein
MIYELNFKYPNNFGYTTCIFIYSISTLSLFTKKGLLIITWLRELIGTWSDRHFGHLSRRKRFTKNMAYRPYRRIGFTGNTIYKKNSLIARKRLLNGACQKKNLFYNFGLNYHLRDRKFSDHWSNDEVSGHELSWHIGQISQIRYGNDSSCWYHIYIGNPIWQWFFTDNKLLF